MARGPLIVFEGAEGAGKTTQLRRLASWLESGGRVVHALREPGGTPLGDEIRRLLLDPASDIAPRAEALLFMASRAQLVERLVRPALEAGQVVLLDRFFLSTYAYQGAGRGLPEAQVRQANAVATSGLVPDVTLLLTLPVREGLARAERRGARDRMEQNADEFHHRVSEAFTTFASAAWQAQHPECGPIVIVDASGSEDAVFARVRAAVEDRLRIS
ncbi:MAG TPA: dTMP kinase [Gemmatimonadaceae bacterium]|nr:dTMP kinase [Gemmatimonadaceae bacterium]